MTDWICLSDFCQYDPTPHARSNDDVEEAVAGWSTLILDAPLDGEEIEDNVLVSSGQFVGLILPPTAEMSYVEALRSRAIPVMSCLVQFGVIDVAMTESEAERILSILCMGTTLKHILVYLGSSSDGIGNPLKSIFGNLRH